MSEFLDELLSQLGYEKKEKEEMSTDDAKTTDDIDKEVEEARKELLEAQATVEKMSDEYLKKVDEIMKPAKERFQKAVEAQREQRKIQQKKSDAERFLGILFNLL